MDSHNKPVHISDLFHKEKNQKKNNKTKGQYDKLEKYGNPDKVSSDKLTTSERQLKREAKYMKNLHIDHCYEQLINMGLITSEGYQKFWCGALHKLGTSFVMAQADLAIKEGRVPAALFHFQINKALNKQADPFMPRFNTDRAED